MSSRTWEEALNQPQAWPQIPYEDWRETADTIHMWTQIVGKVRLELSPMMNEWWQVPLYVNSRGLTTSPIPYQNTVFEVNFDFLNHSLDVLSSKGRQESLPLKAEPVASFYRDFFRLLEALDIDVSIQPVPVEIPDPIPFEEDTVHSSYDGEAASRFFRALVVVDTLLKEFRANFTGKVSPVQFFWGTFDMAVSLFSGRHLEKAEGQDCITRIALDEEQVECGFWPGSSRYPHPAFYSFTYPKPDGIEERRIRPDCGVWDSEMGEFLLRYDDALASGKPRNAVMDFLYSTYVAGAECACFPRERLEYKVWREQK